MKLLGVVLFVMAEFYLIGHVMDEIGVGTTLLTLLLTAFLGGKVAKQGGLATLGNIMVKLQNGVGIGLDLVEGSLFVVVGFLFIFPGFISDVLALLLLFSPIRRLVAMLIIGSFGHGWNKTTYTPNGDAIIEGEVCGQSETTPAPVTPLLPPREEPPNAPR